MDIRFVRCSIVALGLATALLAQGAGQAPAPPPPSATPPPAAPPPMPAATHVDLDRAIELAIDRSPSMLGERMLITESQAQEITAGIRPNPVLGWDMLYLPIFQPGAFSLSYLNNTAEYDASLAYTIERGHKLQARVTAARDATTVVRSQVNDAGRSLSFNVAQQFINILLAKSTLDFGQQDLASWQNTTRISQAQFQAGAMSQADLDTIQVQTLQYETTVSQSRLSLAQARFALRQAVGLEALADSFTADGDLVFQPLNGSVDDYKTLALQNRPDLIAARQNVIAAQSQLKLQQANGKRDLTVTGQYSHVGGLNDAGALFSIEVPIWDKNQGNIAQAAATVTQIEDQAQQANEQVLSDVATAYAAVQEGAGIIKIYDSGYRDQAKQVVDIRQYSFTRGASSLLDLLDAQRTYRQTELAYRQALATYMLAVEQLKEAIGTRSLP